MQLPPVEVVAHFRVSCTGYLGGRLNWHWRVRAGGESLVLRRWHTDLPEVEYELRVLKKVAALGWPVPVAVSPPFA